MKRPLTILAIIALSALIVYACGSTIPTGSTSFVTISIGGDSRTAKLHAEQATAWTRFKYFLADAKIMPEAQAYVPSVVQVIIVTVSAADITTPIVGIDSLTPDQTSSTIRIEVPNGAARQFTVEGIRGIDSKTYYRGTATADLDGTDVNLPISMSFVGPGIRVDTLHSQASDTAGCGTTALPCKTIGYALASRTSGTDAIIVSAGTYTLTIGAGPSTLQLKPGNALICLGTNFSTVIDASSTVDDLIYGAEGASVDNCKLIPGSDTTAIDDRVGGAQVGTPARIKINGVLIDANPATGGALDGILLSAESTVIESTIQNTTWHGITILGGQPRILNNMIASNPIGIEAAVEGVTALVTGNTISGNATGIDIASIDAMTVQRNNVINNVTGISIGNSIGTTLVIENVISGNTTGIDIVSSTTPTVQGNEITNNTTGIAVGNGTPWITMNTVRSNFYGITITGGIAQIKNNSIDHNNAYGVNISTSTGDAKVNYNTIYCNSIFDVYIPAAMTTIDLQNNAWDHDAATVPQGPLVSGTGSAFSSYDIVYSQGTPTPLYDQLLPAVPGGCVPIPVQ